MSTALTTIRYQQASRAAATHWGQTWTLAELELLEATSDLPALEVAECLGRTLYAVWVARHGLKSGTTVAAMVRTPKAATKAPEACGACYTVHPKGIDCY